MLKQRRHEARPLLTRSASDALARHRWPGNLRELTGTLDEVVALAEGDTIRLEHLPSQIQRPYLELPLHERTQGFLFDELDGGGLPEEHVVWRIDQVNQSLAMIPLPPANENLVAIRDFLTLLPDNSEDDRRVVAEVDELLLLRQQLRAAEANHEFWNNVLAGNAPTNVEHLVRATAEQAKRMCSDLARKIRAANDEASFESNPWLRLLSEVQSAPLFQNLNKEISPKVSSRCSTF